MSAVRSRARPDPGSPPGELVPRAGAEACLPWGRAAAGLTAWLVLAGCEPGGARSGSSAVAPPPPASESPVVASTGIRAEPAPAWTAPPDGAAGAACAGCHAELAEAWSRTGMARALGPVHPDELEGLLGASVEDPAGYAYHLERTDGATEPGTPGALLVETCRSAPEHRLEADLAYAVGAGELDRSYVARIAGRESFAPVEVVTDPAGVEFGRHAALSPAHAAQPGLRFGLGITAECLGCHTDRLPPPDFPLDLARPASWQPSGITCAACHGDVETHARIREGEDDELDPRDDPVLRPELLTRVERMSICAVCHLQGDVRIRLDGRLDPIAPGGDLLEQMALFVAREPTDEIGFVSHTERLVMSRCYVEDDSLACDTCHDPHRTLFGDRFPNGPEAGERARVRAACLACHAADAPRGDAQAGNGPSASSCSRELEPDTPLGRDCVDCHMRRTTTFDVAEVLIHDHFIQRRPGPPSPPTPPRALESPAAEWARFAWPDHPLPAHGDDPGLLMMALASRGQTERALALVDRPVDAAVDGLATYHESRARLLEGAGRIDEALAAYERALALDPGSTAAAVNLGLLHGLAVDRARGIELLSQVIGWHPRAEKALRNRAGLRFELGDTGGFEADLEAAFAAKPDPEVAELLADWRASLGDEPGAAAWRERALQLAPLGPPAN